MIQHFLTHLVTLAYITVHVSSNITDTTHNHLAMIIFVDMEIQLFLWPVTPPPLLPCQAILQYTHEKCVYSTPFSVILPNVFPSHASFLQLQVDQMSSATPPNMLFHVIYHI